MPSKQIGKVLVEVFDPAKGEDFQIGPEGNPWFSSFEFNCAVVRVSWKHGWIVNRVPISRLDAGLICKTLSQNGQTGFFSINPKDSLAIRSISSGTVVGELGDSLFSQFPLEKSSVTQFLEELETQGTYQEWLIGTLVNERHLFEVRANVRADSRVDLFFWLSQFSLLGSIWSFDLDTGELLTIFRAYEGYEKDMLAAVEAFIG